MKKILLFILVLLLPVNIYASTNIKNRNNLDNLGVNKHWNITDNNRSNVLNTYLVDANEKIYDFANVLTDSEEEEITKKFINFIELYNTDLVFLTIDLPYINDHDNEEYAADFYDYNDFGINFSNYSGILLLRNTYSIDPYYNIYMFGDAQLYIDWNRSENILDSIYNDFHYGNYSNGLKTYLNLLESYYKQGIPNSRKNYIVNKDGYLKKVYVTPVKFIIISALIIDSITILVLMKKNKMVKEELSVSQYRDNNKISITHSQDNFIRSHTTTIVHSSSSSGGGGFSSGGSSGGGHFSGGGRHG